MLTHRSSSRIPFSFTLCITVLLFQLAATSGRAGEIDFGRQIRPILSDKCFQCHGSDAGTRHADLRLDIRDEATATRDTGRAITPGHPEASLIIERIYSADPDVQMPPPDANKSLSAEQKDMLRKWVEQGAPYSKHWAFQAVQDVLVPTSRDPWCRNPIDVFVLQRLQAAGISPAAEADRATLIRRLYQDLLGLLPTPEETAAFVNDESPDAYERLVDRLLASPHYGERWGRHWLDQARYADSHGFTIDGPRVMWPYRDWVINAFNNDLPFDQFTIEQLAGDLLPNPTNNQLIATGFHRNTLINQEGGVKPDQYRHEAIIDRVNTTATVWLGLTMACAQCHTHKFDPVTHVDYYRMYAFFNRCKDANDVGTTTRVLQGEVFGITPQHQQNLDRLQELRSGLRKLEATGKQAVDDHYRSVDWKWNPAVLHDYTTAANGTFQRLADGTLLSDQNAEANDTYQITARLPASAVTALRLRVLPHPSLPRQGPGLANNGNFVLTKLLVKFNGKPIPLKLSWANHEQADYPAMAVIDGDPKSGWAINLSAAQKSKNPTLAMNAPHELSVLFEKPLILKEEQNEITIEMYHGANSGYLIGRFGFDYSTSNPSGPRDGPDPLVAEMRQQIKALEAQVPGQGIAVQQMIMEDLQDPPATYRLQRGDFLQPSKEEGVLTPGIPAALDNSNADPLSFQNRLDLARWLVSRRNPLTARVTVNRIWMHYFGRGIVETENDFGFQGSPPSHPELLDWLAGEFMNKGWSMKQLHRTIVNSATYRQSSAHRPELEEIDLQNILMARQSRFRVEGEIVRDQALCASGMLVPHVGGPSVFPPQPDGVYAFTQNKKNWTVSEGADRYRRTLYTMFYRSAPYPLLTTFDSPDFNSACTKRPRSNTPLQSLTLANDEVFIELTQRLAAQLTCDSFRDASFQDQLNALFQRCLSRNPNEKELDLLKEFWESERQRFLKDPAAARLVANIHEEEALDVVAETAAWTSAARVVMNTDEFVTRN